MPWVYRVQEVKTEKKTGETYVLVYFWPTRAAFTRHEKPAIEEDFIMQLRSQRQHLVTNDEGKALRQSGIWASPGAPPNPEDPPVRKTVEIDVAAQIKENIERFLKQHHHVRGSLRDPAITADASDPRGILAKPEVSSLAGKDFDEPTLEARLDDT